MLGQRVSVAAGLWVMRDIECADHAVNIVHDAGVMVRNASGVTRVANRAVPAFLSLWPALIDLLAQDVKRFRQAPRATRHLVRPPWPRYAGHKKHQDRRNGGQNNLNRRYVKAEFSPEQLIDDLQDRGDQGYYRRYHIFTPGKGLLALGLGALGLGAEGFGAFGSGAFGGFGIPIDGVLAIQCLVT